uniref:Uncharacterized protein n=1 Tax=Ananas comosus var. bracteatus TaxID=296719 RepID=A0A6V7QBE2_ANACO|nr:unnamed protein product [Ananas comosus var. bracteatus]
MARVPRSVVRGLAPKPKNLDFGQLSDWLSGGLVPVQGCACTGTEPRTRKPEPRFAFSQVLYRHRACTGTVPQDRAPEPRFWIFVALVPVQDPVYRYKAADFAQFGLQGCFCVCISSIYSPTPLSCFFELETAEDKGRSLQAGTPELAYATFVRSCGIEKPTGSSGQTHSMSRDVGLPQALRRRKLDYLCVETCSILDSYLFHHKPSTQGEARDRGKGVASS